MALNLDGKKAVVAEVGAVAARAQSLVAAEYRGLTVAQMTSLRTQARSVGVYVRVVKNSLARRALEGTAFECISPRLAGPLLLAFGSEDPGSAARLVRSFSKNNEKLVATALAVSGQLLAAEQLEKIASLPTHEQALAILMGVMKAPIQKLAGTLAATQTKLVRTLVAVREQKQAAAAGG